MLIFIDEAEVLLPDRNGFGGRPVRGFEQNQVAAFLTEMDGIQESGAFVLLATNRPEAIDQALLRDGRIDLKIKVERPTFEAAETLTIKVFKDVPTQESSESLAFAALESMFDPHKIIRDGQAVGLDFEKREVKDLGHLHFCLHHIISGAMLAGLPARAKRHAFARDKTTGVFVGVTTGDVLQAVNEVFNENENLDHSYAMEEFRVSMQETMSQKMKKM